MGKVSLRCSKTGNLHSGNALRVYHVIETITILSNKCMVHFKKWLNLPRYPSTTTEASLQGVISSKKQTRITRNQRKGAA